VRWFRRTPLAAARWVVIDCETSGLDPSRDRLLSVAAIEVAEERILASGSYSAIVQQQEPSEPRNMLIHGLGAEAQLGGRAAPDVLRELAAFVGERPVAGFHAPFDRAILSRAFARAGMSRPKWNWLDLATLAPAFFPGRAAGDLDSWLAAFSIECPARHDALGDAYATAQLLLVMLAEARRQRVSSAESLIRLAASAQRMLPSR
jgi:DNA polymerase-3 subunit epsilon